LFPQVEVNQQVVQQLVAVEVAVDEEMEASEVENVVRPRRSSSVTDAPSDNADSSSGSGVVVAAAEAVAVVSEQEGGVEEADAEWTLEEDKVGEDTTCDLFVN
jgi:hypothetical protein